MASLPLLTSSSSCCSFNTFPPADQKPVESAIVGDSPCSRICWCSYGHSSGSAPGSSGLEPPSPSGPRTSRCALSRRSTSTVKGHSTLVVVSGESSIVVKRGVDARCSYLCLDDVPGVPQTQVGVRVVQSQAVLQILLGVLAHLQMRDATNLGFKGSAERTSVFLADRLYGHDNGGIPSMQRSAFTLA